MASNSCQNSTMTCDMLFWYSTCNATFHIDIQHYVASLIFKSLQKSLPYPFIDYFTPPRNADHLRPPFCSHKLCEFSVRVMGPRIWNRIKKELKTIGNCSAPCKSYTFLNTMMQVNSPNGFKRIFFHRHHMSI